MSEKIKAKDQEDFSWSFIIAKNKPHRFRWGFKTFKLILKLFCVEVRCEECEHRSVEAAV